jgi:hypothetical protein
LYRANDINSLDLENPKMILVFVTFIEEDFCRIPKCLQLSDVKSIQTLPLPGDRVKIQITKSVISTNEGQRDFIRVLR